MSPTMMLMVGAVLIWLVASGRAKFIWQAIQGSAGPAPGAYPKPASDPASSAP